MKPKVKYSYELGPIYKTLDEAWLGGFEFAKAIAITLTENYKCQETIIEMGETPEVQDVTEQE